MKNLYSLLVLINSCLLSAQAPNIDWQKTFGGNGIEILYSINQTIDGGFIIGGSSTSGISGDKTVANNGNLTSDYWIIKTDMLGEVEWQKSIGGYGAESYTKIIQTSDDGYIIGGNSLSDISGDKTENSFGDYDYWVVKLDSLGNVQWDKTLGGSAIEYFENIIETTDGGYLVGGTSPSPISGNKTENYVGYNPPLPGPDDYWVVKLDLVGNILWQNTIGSNGTELLRDIINTPDGGYLLGGVSDGSITGDKTEISRGGFYDYWVVKLESTGAISWQRTIGGSKTDHLFALMATDDGYLLGGESNSPISGEKTQDALASGVDFWILKLDTSGTIIWQKTIGGTGADFFQCITKDTNGNFLLGGFSDSNISFNKSENSRGGFDFWVVKINSSGIILWDKTIGGAQNEGIYGMCYDVIDDSFVFGGPSLSSNTGDKTDVSRGSNDYWVVKLASESLATHNFNTTSISVYPNPTNNTVHILLPQIYEKVNVTISNIIGELIQKETDSNTSKIDIDLKGTNGIYFLNLTNENSESITLKVLKE